MKKRITPVFEKHGKWYIAYVRELPGANSQGRTLVEARTNLEQAVKLVREANRRLRCT